MNPYPFITQWITPGLQVVSMSKLWFGARSDSGQVEYYNIQAWIEHGYKHRWSAAA